MLITRDVGQLKVLRLLVPLYTDESMHAGLSYAVNQRRAGHSVEVILLQVAMNPDQLGAKDFMLVRLQKAVQHLVVEQMDYQCVCRQGDWVEQALVVADEVRAQQIVVPISEMEPSDWAIRVKQRQQRVLVVQVNRGGVAQWTQGHLEKVAVGWPADVTRPTEFL